MALICVKLSKDALTEDYLTVDNFILSSNQQDVKSVQVSIRKFIKTLGEEDKLLIFAHQEKDKLINLLILENECNKAGIELSISLYCKNEDPEEEEDDSYFFREVDINLSEELYGMQVW